ncbi:MAG TPA: FmdE family protein [Thermomicrobiales bacterium]|nr:FmdE family protein [Thermomicrobiales bacterium]
MLNTSAALHDHLCPRQVLGVRMGMCAAELLDMDLPQRDKRLLSIVETDGCFADGVSASTGCWLGRRTLRCVDYGKVAATFIDTLTSEAVRIHPSEASRRLVARYAPTAVDRWHAYLEGYQIMPTEELLVVESVQLVCSVEKLVSRPDHKTICATCHEEIFNEREIVKDGRVLCRGCAKRAYFMPLPVSEGCQGGK